MAKPPTREPSADPDRTLGLTCSDADELVEVMRAALATGSVFVPTREPPPRDEAVMVSLACPGLAVPMEVVGVVRTPRQEGLARGGVEVSLAALGADDRATAQDLVARIAARDPAVLARVVGVLVVEDNPFNAQLIKDGLRAVGRRSFQGRLLFDVITAHSVAEATELLGRQPLDAVITDFYLAGEERGTALIHAIRDDAELASMAVLAMSAGAADVGAKCLAAGADGFLHKPVRMREIAQALAELLGAGLTDA